MIARPSVLAAAPAARRVIGALVPDERFERYRGRTGIDIRALESLVWAELEEGSLLIARGPFGAPMAVAEMGARMLPLESQAEEPFRRRAGHYLGERRDLAALGPQTLLSVTGSPSLTGTVLARARGESSSPSAIASARPELLDAPLVLVVPHPLELPPGSGVALLLARQRSLVATATPRDAEHIELVVVLEGEFPPGADQNFRRLVASLAETPLGAALGMSDVLATLSAGADDRSVTLRATVRAATLAGGLRVLFEAEIAEIVGSEGGRPERRTGGERGR